MARSEVCKVCCPSGGAIFDVGPSRADYAGDAPLDPQRFVKICRNCGGEKPWRVRGPRPCKIGTVPHTVYVHGHDKVLPGLTVRVRDEGARRWERVVVDSVGPGRHFFAQRA
jgi:hypothetical protein